MDAELVKWVVVGLGIIFVFIFLILSMKNKWIQNFSAGKDGIKLNNAEKEKKLQSGNLDKMMSDAIIECDGWLKDKSTEYADAFRRGLSRFLDPFIHYPSGKRSVSGAIRFPLYNAIRSNKFKIKLRPENIEEYLDILMEKIREEYDDVDDEQDKFICPIHNTPCIQFPNFDELPGLREQIKKHWLIPTKEAQIEMHRKKIEIYNKYIPTFQDIGDDNAIAVCKVCIKKNEEYIEALTKRI
jgi:hypothetical protein